ncbi:MAG: glycerate kinase [Dehalococcoidia bacterium]|nr:glycerate kinase [Dehalococcoidia bacterium]
MRIVIAPQEFKGSLTASEAAAAMAVGAREALPGASLEAVPMSDGGPGTVEAVVAASGGRAVATTVRDPLGRPVAAEWGTVGQDTAVIEMAAAAGLLRLAEDERDPRLASTYGVGELVRAALDAPMESGRLIIGQGGSATNDGGAGMAQALGVRFLDADGGELPPGGAALACLERIDSSGLDPRLARCEVVAATDVMNPLCGPEGASLVYGPQKGASPEVARELDAALRRYGEIVERDVGVRVLDVPGAGAAGGLGAGLIAFLGARIEPGVEVVAEVVRLRERVRGADLVLTGEGKLDAQTGYGKTVAGVARIAAAEGVPVIVVAGTLGEGWERILESGVEGVELIVPRLGSLEEAMERPAEMLAAATAWAVNGWLRLRSATGKQRG